MAGFRLFDDGDRSPIFPGLTCDEVERLSQTEIRSGTHPDNPNVHIHVLDYIATERINMFVRMISEARDKGEKFVAIIPEPHPQYAALARELNRLGKPMDHCHFFNGDEIANKHGETPPLTDCRSFGYAQRQLLWNNLDPEIRPPLDQMHSPTKENFGDYAKMITDLGGASLFDCGFGIGNHVFYMDAPLVFRNPGGSEIRCGYAVDEVLAGITEEEWLELGPQFVRLHPGTLFQMAMDPDWGQSGLMSRVAQYALTVGAKQYAEAQLSTAFNHFFLAGGDGPDAVAWNRGTTKIALFGTPSVMTPSALLTQKVARPGRETHVYVTPGIAAVCPDSIDVSTYR